MKLLLIEMMMIRYPSLVHNTSLNSELTTWTGTRKDVHVVNSRNVRRHITSLLRGLNLMNKKYILGFIISILIVVVAVNIPSPYIGFEDSNDWIAFYGSIIGGFAGGFFALLIAKAEIESSKIKDKERLGNSYSYLVNSYLPDIKLVLQQLNDHISNETTVYDMSQNKLFMISYPHLSLPRIERMDEIHELKREGYITAEEEYKFFRINTHISTILEHKERNFQERDIFHKALIDVNSKMTKDEFIRADLEEMPVSKFLVSMSRDWRDKLKNVSGLIDETINDIDALLP